VHWWRAILLVFLLTHGAAGQFTPALLQNDSYWGDGKAEFDLYDAQIAWQGQLRSCEVTHVLVRDNIKPDPNPGASPADKKEPVPAIRMNQTFALPVGLNARQESLSLYWSYDGRMLFCSFAGADLHGTVFKSGRTAPDGKSLVLQCQRYQDGLEKQELASAPVQSVFYDELPLRVRLIDFSKPSGNFEIQLGPSLTTDKCDQIVFKTARVDFKTTERTIEIEVRSENGSDHFTLDADFPFLLREWKTSDGSHLKMKNSLKVNYWDYTKPGDRERALRDPMLRHPD
jgi:hypothetical protein